MTHDVKKSCEIPFGILETTALPGRAPTGVRLTMHKLEGRSSSIELKGSFNHCNQQLRLAYQTAKGKNVTVSLSTSTKSSIDMVRQLTKILDPDPLLSIIELCVDELRERKLHPKELGTCKKV